MTVHCTSRAVIGRWGGWAPLIGRRRTRRKLIGRGRTRRKLIWRRMAGSGGVHNYRTVESHVGFSDVMLNRLYPYLTPANRARQWSHRYVRNCVLNWIELNWELKLFNITLSFIGSKLYRFRLINIKNEFQIASNTPEKYQLVMLILMLNC